MLKHTISTLRKVWGLSQADFGQLVGVTGAYISALELGKNKKLSEGSTKLISKIFNCDTGWLLSGEISRDRCNAIRDHFMLNKVDRKEMAERLGVPEAFLQAVINCEVSPSGDFTAKVFTALGLPDQSEGYRDRMDTPMFAKRKTDTAVSKPYDVERIRLQIQLEETQKRLEWIEERYDELLKKLGKERE